MTPQSFSRLVAPARGPISDGRRARTLRHREAAIDALLELIPERGEIPTADEVAIRAGLSRRTVFRLFDDMDSLHRAARERQKAQVIARFPPPLPSGQSLRARVGELVQHRASVYEFIMPLRGVAERLGRGNPVVDRDIRESREQFRLHLEVMVADAPACVGDQRETALGAAELLTSWSAWRTLRIDQQASIEEATRTVERGVLRALEID